MKQFRMNAILVGALFALTMLAGMIESNLAAPLLERPLGVISRQGSLLQAGALLSLFMAAGIVGIAILLFPVIRVWNETVALVYLGFRIVECGLLLVGALVDLLAIPLSRQFIAATAADGVLFQTMLSTAVAVRYSAYQISMTLLGIGSLFVFATFYRSRQLPRWLSAWGLAGYTLLLASAVLAILGLVDPLHGAGMLMYLPGGVFELLALPCWLIFKGFKAYSPA